jgi:sialic acid synthase SpsE
MAARTQLIAELASNHGGDWALAAEMIRAAAASGADWVKVQLYDAARLRADDPQRDWLAHAQVTRPALDQLVAVAAREQVLLTASVFGEAEAQMAHDAGLTTIKIGSGDSHREDLVAYCRSALVFAEVWLSAGLGGADVLPTGNGLIVFHGLSQYPAVANRNYARLLQVPKAAPPWGWSDHQEGLSTAYAALMYGPRYLERHFTLPHAGRRHTWDTIPADYLVLRKYAESVAWEGTPDQREAVDRYRHRWTPHATTQD